MAKMKAVQVPKAETDFEIVEREIPQPGAGRRGMTRLLATMKIFQQYADDSKVFGPMEDAK